MFDLHELKDKLLRGSIEREVWELAEGKVASLGWIRHQFYSTLELAIRS